ARDALDHLRRVAREVAPHDLEHAARVLQRRVGRRRRGDQRAYQVVVGWAGRRLRFLRPGLAGLDRLLARARGRRGTPLLAHRGAGVLPGPVLVLSDEAVDRVARVRHQPGEDAVEVLRALELVVDDRRRVSVVDDVLVEVAVVLDHVADQPAQEGDVGAGPD